MSVTPIKKIPNMDSFRKGRLKRFLWGDTGALAFNNEEYALFLSDLLSVRPWHDVYESWAEFGIKKSIVDYLLFYFTNDITSCLIKPLRLIPEDNAICLHLCFNDFLEDICEDFGFNIEYLVFYCVTHDLNTLSSLKSISSEKKNEIYSKFELNQLTIGDLSKSIILFRNKYMMKREINLRIEDVIAEN